MQELGVVLICYFLAVEAYCGMWIADYIKDKKKRKKEAYRQLIRWDIEQKLDIKRNRVKLWKSVKK